jgi:hypothetical protein
MLLWDAEVQYVCRNAARQSYGQQIHGPAASCGLSLDFLLAFSWLAGADFNIATIEAN